MFWWQSLASQVLGRSCNDTWEAFGHGHVQGLVAKRSAPVASPCSAIVCGESSTGEITSYRATDFEGKCWSFPVRRILSGTWNILDWKVPLPVMIPSHVDFIWCKETPWLGHRQVSNNALQWRKVWMLEFQFKIASSKISHLHAIHVSSSLLYNMGVPIARITFRDPMNYCDQEFLSSPGTPPWAVSLSGTLILVLMSWV